MSRPTWPTKTSGDEDSEKSSLEQRINQLTTTVENMQNIIDRFINLYESEKLQNFLQRQSNQRVDAIHDNGGREQNNAENQAFKLELLRQVEIHDQQKRQWEQERTQLLKELQYYKSLLQKCPTYNSSTQTVPIGHSLTNNSPTSNSSSRTFTIAINRPYKCREYGKSYRHKSILLRHQDECLPKNSKYACEFCNEEFWEMASCKRHTQISHGIGNQTSNSSRAVDENVIPIKLKKIKEHTMAKEEDKQQQEQKVQQAEEVEETAKALHETLHVSKKQDEKPKFNLSHSFSKLLTLPSINQVDQNSKINASNPISLSLTTPSLNRIDDKARKKFRNNLMLLMSEHNCDGIDCGVVGFKNSIDHAKECTLGAECHLYICKQKHFRSEHLKVCGMKCSECLTYEHFIANEQYMMFLLKMDCTAKQRRTSGIFATAVTTHYVNCGLADIDDDNVDTEMQLSAGSGERIENQTNSAPSEDDEAAGWELLESDLQNIENKSS